MDAKAVESWHKKLRTHPDNSRETPGVTELDASDRIGGRTRRRQCSGRLAGAGDFSSAELAKLATLASVYATETTLTGELRQEINRRNR